MSGAGAAALRWDESEPHQVLAERVGDLLRRYGSADAQVLLTAMIRREFRGRIALVSSFGAEAAVLLHMVAQIDPATPVVFLNTGKMFGETLRYRDTLVERLGLSDVHTVTPDPQQIADLDGDGVLWYGNSDMCCYIRKVEPLRRALVGFDAQISGRKGYHGGARKGLPVIEADSEGRVKLNPLAGWSPDDINAYFEVHDLPRHPLVEDGFLSVGCMPCTDRVRPGEDVRAGRWRGSEKTECGIHLPIGKWKSLDSGI